VDGIPFATGGTLSEREAADLLASSDTAPLRDTLRLRS
jgi:hypothetical protein